MENSKFSKTRSAKKIVEVCQMETNLLDDDMMSVAAVAENMRETLDQVPVP